MKTLAKVFWTVCTTVLLTVSLSAQNIYTTTGQTTDWFSPLAWTCTGPTCNGNPYTWIFYQ